MTKANYPGQYIFSFAVLQLCTNVYEKIAKFEKKGNTCYAPSFHKAV